MEPGNDLDFHPFVTPNNIERIKLPNIKSIVEEKSVEINAKYKITEFSDEEILEKIKNKKTSSDEFKNIARQKGINHRLSKKEIIELLKKELNVNGS